MLLLSTGNDFDLSRRDLLLCCEVHGIGPCHWDSVGLVLRILRLGCPLNLLPQILPAQSFPFHLLLEVSDPPVDHLFLLLSPIVSVCFATCAFRRNESWIGPKGEEGIVSPALLGVSESLESFVHKLEPLLGSLFIAFAC